MADGKAVSMTTAQEMIEWGISPPTWWKSSRGQVTTHITAVCVWGGSGWDGCMCSCTCVSSAAVV